MKGYDPLSWPIFQQTFAFTVYSFTLFIKDQSVKGRNDRPVNQQQTLRNELRDVMELESKDGLDGCLMAE